MQRGGGVSCVPSPSIGQSQENVARDGLLLLVQPPVNRLRRLGDGAVHAARLGVAIQREGVTLAAFPGLQHGVGKQGQRAGFFAHVAEEQINQARLKVPAADARGFLDGPAQFLRRHRPDVDLVVLQRQAQILELGAVLVKVGAQGDDDDGWTIIRSLFLPGEETLAAVSRLSMKALRSAGSRHWVNNSSN